MRNILLAVAALALGACDQTEDAADQTACAASGTNDWDDLRVEAAVTGDDCANAQATLIITDDRGDQLMSLDYPTNQVMVLAHATSAADMQAALSEWIAPPREGFDQTGELPAWPEGAAQPILGEFYFYPDEGVDRAAYEAIRAQNAPMYCWVQGMESEACFAYVDGNLRAIGAQTFPG